jgi:hypothetical protein
MPTVKPTADFTYTDQELLNLWREAHAVCSVRGQSYTVLGQTVTSFDLEAIRKQIEFYEARVSAANGLSVNLARMK